MAFEVQSVIFNKGKWTQAKARKWLLDHGYKTTFYSKGVDETANYYRVPRNTKNISIGP